MKKHKKLDAKNTYLALAKIYGLTFDSCKTIKISVIHSLKKSRR